MVAILRVSLATFSLATALAVQSQLQHKWEWYKPYGDATPAPTAEAQKAAGPAIEACYDFFKRIGQTPSKETPVISSDSTSPFLTVSFRQNGRFFYAIRKGYVSHYYEHTRPLFFYERAKKKVPFKYPSTTEALVRIKQLAKQLGVPANYTVVEAGRFDKKHPIKGKSGVADAVFEFLPYGYRFLSGMNGHRIRIDPTDGLLLEYSHFKNPPYTIESHVPKLSLAKAKAIADRLTAKYRLGKLEPYEKKFNHTIAPARPSCLRYVFPNGRFDGLHYDGKELPHRARLAWIVEYPRGDRIFVDAADGRILGGVTHLDLDRSKLHG